MAWNFGDILDAVEPAVPPDHPAFIHGERVITSGEARQATNNLARALIARGAAPGDKIAIYMRNRPEYLMALAAGWKARLTHVNVNYRYTPEEVWYIFDNADAQTVVYASEFRDAVAEILLHMSRLEGGALAIARAPFSVSEVIVRAVAVRTRGGRPGVQLSLTPRLAEAQGDPILFEQAFGNVFENALRYAPASAPILVRADRQGEAIRVEVLDEGPGVPDDELPRIFEKFYRARGAGQKAGTGLGLAIARGLMEAMGGTIAARNRPDRAGLSVSIELPVAP